MWSVCFCQVTYEDQGTYVQRDYWNKEISIVKVAVTCELARGCISHWYQQLLFTEHRARHTVRAICLICLLYMQFRSVDELQSLAAWWCGGYWFRSWLVLFVWSLHVLPMYAWVLSGYSGFLPLPKNKHFGLTGDSELSWAVSVDDLWPCDGLATCPGCALPLTQWQLG